MSCHLIQRDIVSHHAPQTVDEGREGDCAGGIAISGHLGARASEITECTPLCVCVCVCVCM